MAAPKKHQNRPRKNEAERRRRLKVQRRRLVSLGMTEEAVQRLDSKKIRFLLRRPKQRIKASA